MSVSDSIDVAIEVFGGLVQDISPTDLPAGVSPDCQDCQFTIGTVKTRPGVSSLYTLPGNPTVNYQKTYETLQEIPRFLSLDSLGVFRKDSTPGGALSVISSSILPNTYANSDSLFGREYIGFGNGINGTDLPRQYDDVNFDRISQVGPGQSPTAVDENAVANLLASPVGATQAAPVAVNSASQNGNIVTLTTLGTFNILIGDPVIVLGVGSGYDGTWPVLTNPNSQTITFAVSTAGLAPLGSGGTMQNGITSFSLSTPLPLVAGLQITIAGVGVMGYNGTWTIKRATSLIAQVTGVAGGLANSGNGTITISGNIPSGKHQISVIFVTRNSAGSIGGAYFTKPAPPNSWVAAGGKRAVVVNIPIGPPNVIARILSFTAANGASFYHLGPTGITIATSNMYIADNTTTSVTVDFSDQVLLLGTNDDALFRLIELPPVVGTIGYSDRLFGWGEQNNLQSFVNLSFDGGFSNPGSSPNFPLGWTPDTVNAAGGASAITQGNTAVFGDAYQISGNGATATRGLIAQSAFQDYLLNPLVQPNIAYTVRARISVNAAAAAGAIHVNLKSASQSFMTVGISLAWNQLTQNYAVYTGNLTSGIAVIPSDLVLQVYVDGTPNASAVFLIDCIEIFPTAQQFNNSNVRASKAEDPESFDSESGLLTVALNNGQSVRAAFRIRERLYFVKEHSFYATQDDGINEPAQWSIEEVSRKVGTPSVHGVGIGEDWVVIAHRTGLYIYSGGEPEKISQEIQPLWDSINWQFGYTISVAVDTRKRRILVCAPVGASTIPNKVIVLDYHDVGGASAIASSPPVHLTYTGRKTAFDKARKWCPWTIPANSIAQIEQSNGQTEIYFGSNDGTGNINLLDDTGVIFADNGAQIPFYYITAPFVEQPQEQALQLRSHRKLYAYMTIYATGNGLLGITAYKSTLSNAQALNPLTLSAVQIGDLEMMLNQLSERLFLKFSNSGTGQFADIQKVVLSVKPSPWDLVAGAH